MKGNKLGKNMYKDDILYNWEINKISRYITIKSTMESLDILSDSIDEIENPEYIDESKNICYYKYNDEITLEDYIKGKKLEAKTIDLIMIKLFKIFLFIENRNLIISAVSLSDFWITSNDINNIRYRVRRRLIKNNTIPDNYNYEGEIVAPEINSKLLSEIKESANVYLLGKLFQKLIFSGEKMIETDKEIYYSYFLNMFRPDISYEYHEFLIKNTNILSENRQATVQEAFRAFYEIVKRNIIKEENNKVEFIAKTDVGRTKFKIAIEKASLTKTTRKNEHIDENEYNEDVFYCNCINEKYIFAVADGVSTASYGSGKLASNIIKNNIESLWNEVNKHIQNEEDVEEFIREIIIVSNRDINEAAKLDNAEVNDEIGDVMASTLVIAIIINGIMYYTSIGDSKIFVYNNKIGMNLINYEDNIGNYNLLKGQSWNTFNNADENKVLANYIGGGKVVNKDIVSRKIKIEVRKKSIFQGDIILLSSDGLTDYISPIYSNTIYNQTLTLSKLFKENYNSIEKLGQELIVTANNNGGGDNITLILAKVN